MLYTMEVAVRFPPQTRKLFNLRQRGHTKVTSSEMIF